MKISPVSLIFLIFISAFTSCAKLERDYPERNYYMLNFSTGGDSNNNIRYKNTTLLVNHFSVSPGSIGTEFIYRVGDTRYKADFYNQFFRSPGALISEGIRRWLSDSSLFQYVLYTPVDAKPDYVLDGNVIEIYGDFREGSTPRALLGMQLFLTDKNSKTGKVIFHKNYKKEIPIGSRTAKDLVQGWNEALTQTLREFETDLSQAGLGVSN